MEIDVCYSKDTHVIVLYIYVIRYTVYIFKKYKIGPRRKNTRAICVFEKFQMTEQFVSLKGVLSFAKLCSRLK